MFLVLVLGVFHFFWVCTQQLADMPYEKEITLSPEVIEAVDTGRFLNSEHCREPTTRNLQTALKLVKKSFGNGVIFKMRQPCSICIVSPKEKAENLMKINVTDFQAHRIYKESAVLDVTLQISNIRVRCEQCIFSDDEGNQHTGEFRATITKALFNVLAENILESGSDIPPSNKILLVNATNFDRRYVHVECLGDDDKFKEVCKKADDSRELDEVVHAILEQIFRDGIGEQVYSNGGHLLADRLNSLITAAFTCKTNEESNEEQHR